MKSLSHGIQLALFDMDGLLFDTENLFLSLTEETERELGRRVPKDLHYEAIGRSFEDVQKLFMERLGEDFPFRDFFSRTKERVYERVERYGMPVKEGVHELLAALAQRNITVVLASSSPRWMIEKNLEAAGMSGEFGFSVGGDEVERGKPYPDLFLAAAQKQGAAPERCIVFEDSNNGVRAAHAAGMRVIMVPDLRPPEQEVREKAYRVYDSLLDAVSELDELLE